MTNNVTLVNLSCNKPVIPCPGTQEPSRAAVFFCSGSVVLPKFLSLNDHDHAIWITNTRKLVENFENKIKAGSCSVLKRSHLVLILEAVGGFRIGHLGNRRNDFTRWMAQNFGENSWWFRFHLNGVEVCESEIYDVYTEAYKKYFKANLGLAKSITEDYGNVYDTAPSNVKSGLNYFAQESPEYGIHLHDIAIRNALKELGFEFKGRKLLEIRGKNSKGFSLSPGQVPFGLNYQYLPFPESWWQPESVESWYQSSRFVVVSGFESADVPVSHWSDSHPDNLGAVRVAARFLLRILAGFTPLELSNRQDSTIYFRPLQPSDFPKDEEGTPRKFAQNELISALESFWQLHNFAIDAIYPGTKAELKKRENLTRQTLWILKQIITGASIDQVIIPEQAGALKNVVAQLRQFIEESSEFRLMYESKAFEENDRYFEYVQYRKNLESLIKRGKKGESQQEKINLSLSGDFISPFADRNADKYFEITSLHLVIAFFKSLYLYNLAYEHTVNPVTSLEERSRQVAI